MVDLSNGMWNLDLRDTAHAARWCEVRIVILTTKLQINLRRSVVRVICLLCTGVSFSAVIIKIINFINHKFIKLYVEQGNV